MHKVGQFPKAFIEALVGAATEEGLRSIMVFDAPFSTLSAASHLLQNILKALRFQSEIVTIGPTANDDNLWGKMELFPVEPGSENPIARWRDGILVSKKDSIKIIITPDLASQTLDTARAGIQLLDAPFLCIERHGYIKRQQPNIIWLAACKRSDVGRISSHLLDRFALRLNNPKPEYLNRTNKIKARINKLLDRINLSTNSSKSDISDHTKKISDWVKQSQLPLTLLENEVEYEVDLPKEIEKQLNKSSKSFPEISNDAIERTYAYLETIPNLGMRRELALLRLARSYARLLGDESATAKHIDLASNTIGLSIREQFAARQSSQEQQDEFQKKQQDASDLKPLPEIYRSLDNRVEGGSISEDVFASHPPVLVGSNTAIPRPLPEDPYPELNTPIEHDGSPLRFPYQPHHISSFYGQVIGTQKANNLNDISVVSTIIEAAKFQIIRRQKQPKKQGIILHPNDLRTYRRAFLPSKLFALLIDYTCLDNTAWQDALLPYLQWSYVEKTPVCLVTVGARSAHDELQAEVQFSKTILSQSIARTLELSPGRATPLAHGLELIRLHLEKNIQKTHKSTFSALVVIVTDGRGNIPILASKTLKIEYPVQSKGINDALNIAQSFGHLKGISTVLLYPERSQYSQIPINLASKLSARMEKLPVKVSE